MKDAKYSITHGANFTADIPTGSCFASLTAHMHRLSVRMQEGLHDAYTRGTLMHIEARFSGT